MGENLRKRGGFMATGRRKRTENRAASVAMNDFIRFKDATIAGEANAISFIQWSNFGDNSEKFAESYTKSLILAAKKYKHEFIANNKSKEFANFFLVLMEESCESGEKVFRVWKNYRKYIIFQLIFLSNGFCVKDYNRKTIEDVDYSLVLKIINQIPRCTENEEIIESLKEFLRPFD